MTGDIIAAHQVIEIIRARCRLLGLGLRVKRFGAPGQSPRTVVLTSEEREALGLDQRDRPPHRGCSATPPPAQGPPNPLGSCRGSAGGCRAIDTTRGRRVRTALPLQGIAAVTAHGPARVAG